VLRLFVGCFLVGGDFEHALCIKLGVL
jgi:hypothetical protein